MFKLQACNDGHVGLFESYKFRPYTYEIVIGGYSNMKSEIRINRFSNTLVNTPDILKCDELQQFWVSWLNGRIALGYGEVPGIAEILGVDDPNPKSISYLGLSTGWGATGVWMISNIPGKRIISQPKNTMIDNTTKHPKY